MSFHAKILTLYPEMFPGPLATSISGRAANQNIWSIEPIQLRSFSLDKHHTVDDTPAGGGAGMVLKADVLANAIDTIHLDDNPLILLSPRGTPLTQKIVHDLSKKPGLTLICGRFEGVDERIIQNRPIIEISIGDYILSGGEIAAFVLLDAIIRLLPGVMGNAESGKYESFEHNLLEHPHYTRPLCFEGKQIPEVLLSGHHQKIAKWRQLQAEEITQKRRPDLWKRYKKSDMS